MLKHMKTFKMFHKLMDLMVTGEPTSQNGIRVCLTGEDGEHDPRQIFFHVTERQAHWLADFLLRCAEEHNISSHASLTCLPSAPTSDEALDAEALRIFNSRAAWMSCAFKDWPDYIHDSRIASRLERLVRADDPERGEPLAPTSDTENYERVQAWLKEQGDDPNVQEIIRLAKQVETGLDKLRTWDAPASDQDKTKEIHAHLRKELGEKMYKRMFGLSDEPMSDEDASDIEIYAQNLFRKVTSAWQAISEATPRDREILVRDAEKNVSLVKWRNKGGWDVDVDGFWVRSCGGWPYGSLGEPILVDEIVEWCEVPA